MKKDEIKSPPQNLEFEKSLLGALIMRNEQTFEAQKYISAEDFYHDTHKIIFQAIVDMARDRKQVNVATLNDHIGTEGIASYLAGLVNYGMDFQKVEQIAKRIKDLSRKRWLLQFFAESTEAIETMSSAEMIAEVGSKIAGAYQDTADEDPSPKAIISELGTIQEHNIARFAAGEKYLGVPIGIERIDKILDGVQRNKLYLLNAYTSVGKSMMALNWMRGFLQQKKRVVLFSLEMTSTDLMARLVGMESGINSLSILRGSHVSDDAELKAKDQLYNADLRIYSRKRYLNEIITTMMSENLKKPVDLFVVDYLQHVRGKGFKSKYDLFTEVSNQFQEISQNLGAPILLLSQIDNDSAKSKQTDVIATKGSGDVPGDAEVAILLQHDKKRGDCYQEGIKAVNCYVQKNRGGMTGNAELIMETKTGRFYEAQEYGQLTGRK